MPRARVPRRDRRGLGPDNVARALVDQQRNGQRPQRAHALEGLELVELEERACRQQLLEVEVQAAQVPGDLAELELETTQAQPQQARALAQAYTRRQQLEERRVEIRAMIVAIHAERLAREAALTAAAQEARDWMRPAERLVEAVS